MLDVRFLLLLHLHLLLQLLLLFFLYHAHNNSEFLNAQTSKTLFMAHLKMHLNCAKFSRLAFEYFNRRQRLVALKGDGVWVLGGRGEGCGSLACCVLPLYIWFFVFGCGIFPFWHVQPAEFWVLASASVSFPASSPTPKRFKGGEELRGTLYAVYYMSVYFMPLTISLKFYACVWGPSRW